MKFYLTLASYFKKNIDDAIYIVSVNNNDHIYGKCVLNNENIKTNYSIVTLDNFHNDYGVAELYNKFLDSLDLKQEAWIIFCHNDFQLLEHIDEVLRKVSKKYLYGPFGVKLKKHRNDNYTKEYYGKVYERKRDGSNLRILKCLQSKSFLSVDAFDAQCLIVHTSLIRKFNLRFDNIFLYDLYVEDFCIAAKKYNIKSKILSIECCHWSQIDASGEIRKSYFESMELFYKKYENTPFKFILHGDDNGRMKIGYILPAIHNL